MKLNRLIKSSFLGCLLALASCADDTFHIGDGGWDGTLPDELTMALVIPDPQHVDVAGRASTPSLDINSINVLLFNDNATGDARFISNTPLTDYKITGTDEQPIITITASLASNATRMQVVINAPQASGQKDLSAVFTSVDQSDTTAPVIWGEAILDQATLENPTMKLVRNTAKFTLVLDSSVSNFQILEYGIFGTANEGSLAPADGNRKKKADNSLDVISEKATTRTQTTFPYTGPNGGSDELMHTWTSGATSKSLYGFYETPPTIRRDKNGDGNLQDDYVRVIFKGRYRNASGTTIDGYYVAALKERTKADDYSETPGKFEYSDILPVLRNHEYILTITEVRSEGWLTLDQAILSLPDNRATVLVTDKASAITDIEATRDYYLGVGGDITTDYTGECTIDVATSYPGLVDNPTWRDRLEFETGAEDDWVHVDQIELAADNPADPNYLRLRVPLDQNTSPQARYSYIKVRAGKLSREINLKQEGFPYSRTRKVTMTGMKANPETDYFSWIEGSTYDNNGLVSGVRTDSVQGLTTVQNRGLNRIGLHFPAVPLYNNVTYTIPADAKDTNFQIIGGNGEFNVTKTGSNYVLKLENPNQIKSVTGRFRITTTLDDGSSINIDYNLYCTGVFHYLNPSDASKYQAPETGSHRSGWFYYEIVKLGDTYVLDRDLGASSNQPYSLNSSVYSRNSGAVGGYFMVNKDRWPSYNATTDIKNRREDQQTITSYLNLTAATASNGRFVPATEADILKWNLDCSTVVSALVSGNVADKTIYFSKAGYYEGDELKSSMHSMFWTRTYLGGTQGMSSSAADYGYWYRYFDDMKSNEADRRFSNIRMARGSNGIAPTEESIYRYMPLRLVWVNQDCRNPGGGNVDDNNTVTNRMVIYVKTALSWNPTYYHAWDMASGTTTWGSLAPTTKVDGQQMWRVALGAPQNDGAGIMFAPTSAAGDNYGTDKTREFKELYQRYQDGETVLVLQIDASGNVTCVDAGNEDIYATEQTTSYTYAIESTANTFFNGTNRMSLQKTGSQYELNNVQCQAGYFYIKVMDQNGSTVKLLKSNISSGIVDLGNAMTVIESTASNAVNWRLTAAGIYSYKFNPSTMKLTVTKTVIDHYDLHATFFPESDSGTEGWASRTMTKSGSNWVLNNVEIREGYFGIRSFDTNGDQVEWLTGNGSETVNIGGTTTLVDGGTNLRITQDGTYSFSYNPTSKALTVTKQAVAVDYDYKLKGSIWGDSNWSYSSLMTKTNGKYVLTTTTTAAGSFGIQRYNKGTTTESGWLYGTSSTISYNTPMNVVVESGSNGANWANLPAGKYTFTFDPDAMTLTIKPNYSNDYDYYLHGNIWTSGDTWSPKKLTFDENTGNYTYTGYMYTGNFGIRRTNLNAGTSDGAQNAWYSSTWGDTTAKFGVQMPVSTSGNNFWLGTAGTYTVTFNPRDMYVIFVAN